MKNIIVNLISLFNTVCSGNADVIKEKAQVVATLSFIEKAKSTVYFDIDGTLLWSSRNGIKLTSLGMAIRDMGIEIHCLTFGPWDIDMIKAIGINAVEVISAGTALANGMAEFGEDGLSKKVDYLVDNEDHCLVKNLLKVNFND